LATTLSSDGEVGRHTVGELLLFGRQSIPGSASAALDAGLLLGKVLKRDRAWLLAHHDLPVARENMDSYSELVRRRAGGEPVAYLRGHKEWYGFDLEVSPAVLIPRPETELLVEAAVEVAKNVGAQSVVDIGTGSGAIALALAISLPEVRVAATDVSASALSVARRNIQRYRVEDRVRLLHGDLLSPLSEVPDLVVANLPYLSDELMSTLPRDVQFEPASALHGGRSGLSLYRRLLQQLRLRGWHVPLIAEIDARQGIQFCRIARRLFPASRIQLRKDYAGFDRIVLVSPEAAETSG
jgi:release factor glutamine methyltransferase